MAQSQPIIINSQATKDEGRFDYRELIPKAPDYGPQARWGWGAFCVFDDKGTIVDIVTIKLDFSKGFSVTLGELKHAKLQIAKEIWNELRASGFNKRIVNCGVIRG